MTYTTTKTVEVIVLTEHGQQLAHELVAITTKANDRLWQLMLVCFLIAIVLAGTVSVLVAGSSVGDMIRRDLWLLPLYLITTAILLAVPVVLLHAVFTKKIRRSAWQRLRDTCSAHPGLVDELVQVSNVRFHNPWHDIEWLVTSGPRDMYLC